MSELIEQLNKVIVSRDKDNSKYYEELVILMEQLTFKSSKEIMAMMDYAHEHCFSELPVSARNLALRLAVLQEPENVSLLERAASDLSLFSPDWDNEVKKLDRQINLLKKDHL